ncbi:MAG TPA: TonB-dependent receptor, partial [Candidatus Atribacteria bacterium]|nr:TonB-dependent receptor [Candidatus Atribacteria bacterium]
MKKNYLFLIMLLCGTVSMMAQSYTITGTVTEGSDPLIGVSIVKKGTSTGTITDVDGKYSLEVTNGDVLEFSYVGYTSTIVNITGQTEANVKMSTGLALDEVVVTGNRSKPRTVLDSPVPIDNIGAAELKRSGQTSMDQMLVYKVPSFNSANQAISDATAHFDPADLRGLGPSRTLVLVNGKRKNASAQIYLNGTPGKGEVGTDMKSIPAAAIDHIEVLRDGASSQYGSDAIAGVINIILKKNTESTTVSATTGITQEGDGFNFGVDLNKSVNIGKGNVNFTLEYYDQKLTNRAGSPGIKDLPANPKQNWTDWAINNPRLGMIVGQPDLTKKSVMVNATFPISDDVEFYTFHGYTHRLGRSFAYYRAPYWRGDVEAANYITPDGSFEGYHPTFEAEVVDNISSGGFKFMLAGFSADASVTYGKNWVDYTVNRSVNRDFLGANGWSPRAFKPGGYLFSNILGNLDFSRSFNDMVSASFGFEAKKDRFTGHKGDEHSYYGGGSDSFAGIKPFEATDNTRTSYAGYLGLDFDITKSLLFGAAARYEDFTDFGGNLSWKVNGRYKIGDSGAIRASASTGFRAPSLHQRHIQLSQYIIVAPNPDPQLQGTFPNAHPAVKGFGVPNLFAETSLNFSAGITYRLMNNLSITADVYQIKVK